MTGDVDFTSSRLMSHTLYDFLASELLESALPETQRALMLLAVAATPDVDTARTLLGADADNMFEDAVARGLVAVTERKSLLMHPLLRELLIRRFGESNTETREALLSNCRQLIAEHRWDEALSVAEVARDAVFVTEATEAVLDDLLAAGRTSSLERWVRAARAAGAEGGLIDYAESEALYRGADMDRAIALATQAAGSLDGDLAARAHVVAGRAACLMDRSQVAQEHSESAIALACKQETREQALLAHFLAGIGPQAPDLRQRLEQFKRTARPGIWRTLIEAGGGLTLAEVEGGLGRAIQDTRCALSLAEEGIDPIARTGLLSAYSYALIVVGRYEESLLHTDKLAAIAENYGIEFPLRYAQLYRAAAYVGLRRFALADRLLGSLERQARDELETYFHGNLPLQRARLYASLGDAQRALDALALGPDEQSSPTVRGAFVGWQSLLAAIVGDFRDPARLAETRDETARSVEANALFLLAEAVIAIHNGQLESADACIKAALETEAADEVVITVRAESRVAKRMAERPETATWLKRLLARSADVRLANSIGLNVPRPAKREQKLTPRETEVHELLAQGLTNEEIARLLYISLSTTKVHVKHIYDKLGVRSRLEAARALRQDV
jgi:ATP/maltotriose-dependent transcriptional regulator MalT